MGKTIRYAGLLCGALLVGCGAPEELDDDMGMDMGTETDAAGLGGKADGFPSGNVTWSPLQTWGCHVQQTAAHPGNPDATWQFGGQSTDSCRFSGSVTVPPGSRVKSMHLQLHGLVETRSPGGPPSSPVQPGNAVVRLGGMSGHFNKTETVRVGPEDAMFGHMSDWEVVYAEYPSLGCSTSAQTFRYSGEVVAGPNTNTYVDNFDISFFADPC